MTTPDARQPGQPWRIGTSWGIHVYQGEKGSPGERPVATFHDPADAQRAVDAVNGRADGRQSDEHDIAYSLPHPDLFRADCSCGWVRASPDRDWVYAAVDEHEKETDDGIDWAEVARDDRDQQDQEARALAAGDRTDAR